MDDRERRLLRRTWFPLARAEDVARGPVAGNILGTELVVYPGPDGPTVAQGRCPHRGMALWLGGMREGNLECPYHGWLFAPGTGRCAEVPSLGPGVPLPRVRLGPYQAVVAFWPVRGR